jgi:hypothetical protein
LSTSTFPADGYVFGKSVNMRTSARVAQGEGVTTDVVVPVPDSGV